MQFAQQFVNGLTQGCIYALIALGYTMVYGVLRLINFAHGDVYMLGAYFGLYVSRWTASLVVAGRHWVEAPGRRWAAVFHVLFDPKYNAALSPVGILIVFVAAMVLSALAGVVIERVAYRPLRQAPKLTLLITAIGVSMLLEYGGQLVFSPDPQAFPELVPNRFLIQRPTFSVSWLQATIIGSAVALMLALQFIMTCTRLGRAMRAVSHDRQAAALMGINIDTIIAFTFALGSALAAAAGVLNAVYQDSIDPLMGIDVGLRAFVAAVLGGIGSIPGAMLGGLLMGFAQTGTVMIGKTQYGDAVSFAILIAVLIIRPAGILGRSAAEKV